MTSFNSLTFREYVRLDSVQVLSPHGSIYFGASAAAPAYFASLGRVPTPGISFSDFVLDLVDTRTLSRSRDIATLEAAYDSYVLRHGVTAMVAAPKDDRDAASPRGAGDRERDRDHHGGGGGGGGRRRSSSSSNGGVVSRHSNYSDSVIVKSTGPVDTISGTRTSSEPIRQVRRERLYGHGHGRGSSLGRARGHSGDVSRSGSSSWFSSALDQMSRSFDNVVSLIYDELDIYSLQPLVVRQFQWCLWRALAVRVRGRSEIFSFWCFSSVCVITGLLLCFASDHRHRHHGDAAEDLDSFVSRTLLLSLCPFLVVLLSFMWLSLDATDRKIYEYERTKKYFSPLFFPITSFIADTLILRLVPPLLVGMVIYFLCGLQRSFSAFIAFLQVLVAASVSGACFLKLLVALFAMQRDFEPAHVSMIGGVLLTVLLLLSGPLLQSSTLLQALVQGDRFQPHATAAPLSSLSSSSSLALSVFSFFYWSSSAMCWNEMQDEVFAIPNALWTATNSSSSSVSSTVSGETLLKALYVDQVSTDGAISALALQALLYFTLAVAVSVVFHKQQQQQHQCDAPSSSSWWSAVCRRWWWRSSSFSQHPHQHHGHGQRHRQSDDSGAFMCCCCCSCCPHGDGDDDASSSAVMDGHHQYNPLH